MTLRTRLLSALVLVVIAAAATLLAEVRFSAAERDARTDLDTVAELNDRLVALQIETITFVTGPTAEARVSWQVVRDRIDESLNTIRSRGGPTQVIVRQIERDLRLLDRRFNRLVLPPDSMPARLNETDIEQVFLAIGSIESGISDISRFARFRLQQAIDRKSIAVFTGLGVMVATFLLFAAIAYGVFLRRLPKIIHGVGQIAAGDLEHSIEVRKDDEIGRLARAIETMRLNLVQRTERLKATVEEMKGVDRMKDEFLNMSAHELKTPLVPVRSYAQMLRAEDFGKMTKRQKEAVEIILRNERQMEKLVDDLLDISKLQSSKLQIDREKTHLGPIVEDAADDFEWIAREKGLRVTWNVSEDLPPVMADKGRIRQVLRNLIDNAVKFTPSGGEVEVTAGADQERNEVVVEVRDTGVGIPDKHQDKIFKPFYQVSKGTDREYEGSGLGLSICKGIVEAHGGHIWFRSPGKGEGSVFCFTLPLA